MRPALQSTETSRVFPLMRNKNYLQSCSDYRGTLLART